MVEETTQPAISGDKQENKHPEYFKPGESGNPNGRPKGSISPIGMIKKIFAEDPEEFRTFIDGYRKNRDNARHLVEMLDGKPKQSLNLEGGITITTDPDRKVKADSAIDEFITTNPINPEGGQ